MLGTLCLLISALTYVDTAKVLTQTPAVLTVPVGQQVVFNCDIQRNDGYVVSFYKQVHHHRSGDKWQWNEYPHPDVFGIKRKYHEKGLARKRCGGVLGLISFCMAMKTNGITVVFGGGTKLFVTSSDLPAPVVTVFPPASAELQSKNATLVCVATQSSPYADVTWLARGLPVSGAVTTDPAVRQADQTFKISSYLTVETSDWNTDTAYTCKVSLGSKSAENTINKSKCAP